MSPRQIQGAAIVCDVRFFDDGMLLRARGMFFATGVPTMYFPWLWDILRHCCVSASCRVKGGEGVCDLWFCDYDMSSRMDGVVPLRDIAVHTICSP